jgi:hypothetical protein
MINTADGYDNSNSNSSSLYDVASNQELYLIHSMTKEAEYRLAYTITRYAYD